VLLRLLEEKDEEIGCKQQSQTSWFVYCVVLFDWECQNMRKAMIKVGKLGWWLSKTTHFLLFRHA